MGSFGRHAAWVAGRVARRRRVGVGCDPLVCDALDGAISQSGIIGAAVGAKLGDSVHKKNERIVTLQNTVQDSAASVAGLEQDIDELNAEVLRLQNVARPELVALMQAGIDMDLLFRTDEYALTDTTGNRLSQMAAMLANMPGVQIQLDGFADERGDADYNHALSEKRVEFVRNLFIAAVVHPTRINASAHGEVVAQTPDIDSYALERRVSVKLFIDNSQSVASNPN